MYYERDDRGSNFREKNVFMEINVRSDVLCANNENDGPKENGKKNEQQKIDVSFCI